MCDHAIEYLDIETDLYLAGIVASVGCPKCGERLCKRVPRDGPGDEIPVAEYIEDGGEHVLVEPESLGVGGTEGAWIITDMEPVDLKVMA